MFLYCLVGYSNRKAISLAICIKAQTLFLEIKRNQDVIEHPSAILSAKMSDFTIYSALTQGILSN